MGRNSNTICKVCGKDFYKRPSDKEKYSNHYCSINCRSKDRSKKNKDRICETCGKVFRYKRKDQKFCSLECVASRPRLDKWNGNGKNKSQKILSTLKNNGWNGKCMIDGCEYELLFDIHRIIEGKDGGEYVQDNIIVICPNHHQEIHRLNKTVKFIKEFTYTLED